MSQHAVLSPSSDECWTNCVAAPAMQKGLPDDANEYSDEGTAAHLLGSTCLEKRERCSAYLGNKIHVGTEGESDFAIWEWELSKGFKVRRTFKVDEDMAGYIQQYVNLVREYQGEGEVFPEMRCSISAFTGEEGAEGTTDAPIVRGSELTIIDLKYGMGVKVYAERKKQLMKYALAVRDELEMVYGRFERFRLVISQPRLDHVSEWDCTAEELEAYAEESRTKAVIALRLYHHPGEVKPEHFAPGEETCRWCKAKPTCPALAKFVTDTMEMDFDAVVGIASGPVADVHELVYNRDRAREPADLAQKMAAIPLIEDWCKAIRADVERQLFAGVPIPGWKVVQGKRGNQAWADEEAAEKYLKEDMRVTAEDRCNMKLKSPTQMEKVLKATPKRLARMLKNIGIVQRDGQPSVAPESDKRPVWTPPDTSNDFEATTSEEEAMA